MAPMLEDEIMHDTEKMNSKVVGLARTGKQIYDFIEQLKRAKSTEAQAITDNGLPFSFSGIHSSSSDSSASVSPHRFERLLYLSLSRERLRTILAT